VQRGAGIRGKELRDREIWGGWCCGGSEDDVRKISDMSEKMITFAKF